MPHMHRPGGVGRDIFDIDFFAPAEAGTAVVGAVRQDGAKLVPPETGIETDVDEAGARHLDGGDLVQRPKLRRSEEHTSELQSLMRLSYAVFCLKKKSTIETHTKSSYN